jgi:hypothetical protein
MKDTLGLVLGSDNARLVLADLQRCLLPEGKRQRLIPADFRFTFDAAFRNDNSSREIMFMAQCVLLNLVQDSGDWNQRNWTVSTFAFQKGDDLRTLVHPWMRIWCTGFRLTQQEASLPADDPVAMWQMAGPAVKKVITGILEHSPQLRKDRLVGNILNKQFLRGSTATHPIHTLPGWKRLAPDRDSKTGKIFKVTPGPAQHVMSFLGKATGWQDTPRVVRFNSDVITAGDYAPLLRAKKKKLLSS